MDIDDLWTKEVDGQLVRSARYGRGKRWRARWRDAGGVQRQRSFRTKPEAQAHLGTVSVQLQAGLEVDPAAAKMTVREYSQRWLAMALHEEQSAVVTETALRLHLYPVLGDRRLASIRVSDARSWLAGVERGAGGRGPHAASSTRTILGHVSAVFNAAVADRIIPSNPFKGLTRGLPAPQRKASPPTAVQMATMRAMLPPRLRAVVTVAAGAGLRLGELLGLEVECVDFLRRVVHVRQQLVEPPGDRRAWRIRLPKGRRVRDVPVPEPVIVALSEHLRQWPAITVEVEDLRERSKPRRRPATLIFSSPTEQPVSRKWWYYRWTTGAQRHGLEALTVHDCRHWYASALIHAGESVKVVQARLGHGSAMVTWDVYGHLWPDSDDSTRSAIAGALAAVAGQVPMPRKTSSERSTRSNSAAASVPRRL